LRQREYDVPELLGVQEQSISVRRSHNLVTQDVERELSFAGYLLHLKSLQNLVGSLTAELQGLVRVTKAVPEVQAPFRWQNPL
jgi:hypothetical protein